MILKRQETSETIKAMYDSSNILASTYDNKTNNLVLIFGKGKQYEYPNVSKSDYLRFEMADSQGKVFATHIKKYPFTQLGDINPDLLLKEVVEIKKADATAAILKKQTTLLEVMNGLYKQYNTIPMVLIDEKHLVIISTCIADYLTELKK